MRMALLHRGPAHQDEPGLRSANPRSFRVAAIAHARPQTADELINERGQMPLVRHPPLDAFRHQLAVLPAIAAAALPIAVARTGRHRPERPHAAIRLELRPL